MSVIITPHDKTFSCPECGYHKARIFEQRLICDNQPCPQVYGALGVRTRTHNDAATATEEIAVAVKIIKAFIVKNNENAEQVKLSFEGSGVCADAWEEVTP